jgi:flagellar biosynthesis protein FlhA
MNPLATFARRLPGFASTGAGWATSALLPMLTLAIMGMMVVPVAPWLLDTFFILNIGLSLAVLMVALKTDRPLDFSAFPTVLLFATMLRLALNVASTRAVLVNGHSGSDAAGKVIEAFGQFLISGDYVVGLFVFIILTIINLIVITKGAGRVSEVSARFTLDALPGKQMAIDADLNAGVITGDEARARRAEVALEADFYGSMDGASKFTKGDAVASIIILLVNVIGGLVLGSISHGLSLADAAERYVLLAIGDGLVAQVPALLLSLAAAVIVTRTTSGRDLTGQVTGQFANPAAWTTVSAILALLALLPGMPTALGLGAATLAGLAAWVLRRRASALGIADDAEITEAAPLPEAAVSWDEVTEHSMAGLEIGHGLIDLVDENRRAPLVARITGVRRQLSRELGFVLPPVRIRDELTLAPGGYRILIAGVAQGEDTVEVDGWLALDPGTVIEPIEGRAVRDPSFGLPALWIEADARDAATLGGYTVVDASTVIATHLSQVLRAHAHQLLGQDDVQRLLDGLQTSARALVTGLVPKTLPLATLTGALQALIEEGVPIREFRRVVEAAAAVAHRTTDPVELAEAMRPALGDLIVGRLSGPRESLRALTLEPALETLLHASIRADPSSNWPIEPRLAVQLLESAESAARPWLTDGASLALVVAPAIRRPLRRLLRQRLPSLPIISFAELPEAKTVTVVGVIGAVAQTAEAPAIADDSMARPL